MTCPRLGKASLDISPSIFVSDDKDPKKEPILFPSKKLIGFPKAERVSTSMWLNPIVHKAFIDACSLVGRKSCDVIEPFERAFIECAKKIIFEEKIEPCLLKPIVFNLTLNITEKYDTRGPKPKEKFQDITFCEKSKKSVSIWYCKDSCSFGGNREKYHNVVCENFSKIF